MNLLNWLKRKSSTPNTEVTNLNASKSKEEINKKGKSYKSVNLPSLPADIDVQKLQKSKLIYNSIEKQLSFPGEMSYSERKYFSNLSDNKQYKRAIRSLFLKDRGGEDLLLAFMSLKAGINDKDFVFSVDRISHLIKGNGENYVDFISNALWTIPNTRNSALKILHLISSSGDKFPKEAVEYANKELADWEEMHGGGNKPKHGRKNKP